MGVDYQQVFLNSSSPLVVMDPATHRFVDCNPAAAAMYGFGSVGETVGKTPVDVSASVQYDGTPSLEQASRYIERALREGSVVFDWRHERPDGTTWDAEVHLRRVESEGRTLLQFTLVDITERMRVEKSAQEQAARLSALVNTLPDLVWLKDPDGVYLNCNRRFESFFSALQQDIVGKTDYDFVDRALADFFREHDRKAIAAGQPTMNEEEVAFASDGHSEYLETIKTPVYGANGELLGVLGIGRDITARKQAERDLRAAQERAERYLSAAEVILVGLDLEARVTLLNRKGCEISGYTEGELLGKDWFSSCFPPEERNGVRAIFLRMVSEEIEVVSQYENFIVRRDGEKRLIAWHNTLVRDDAGRVTGSLSSGEDITERKRAEHDLALLKHSIDIHPDAAYWTDESGRFIYINEAGCRALGYRTDELLGKSVEVINPRATAENWQQLWKNLREHGFHRTESVHRRKDGSEFPVEVISSHIRFGGSEYNCAFAHDASERKRAEEEQRQVQARLNQAQKMEAIGTLAGGIAHDFNNILAAIIGNTQLALLELPDGSPVKELLENVEHGATRAAELVRQILTFSRQTKEARKPIQLVPIIKEALKLLRASLPVTLKINEHCEGSGFVLADAGQFHQIVMNLCTNAGLAMREQGGVLDVGLSEIESDAALMAKHQALSPGRYQRLTIKDTGCGIQPENLSRIFEPFFTTRPVGEGTGLGLSVVHGIVRGWGGAIGVTSEVGSGTTFEILLPVCDESSNDEFERATASQGRERVLFIDDEIALTDIARKSLERFGYRVTVFNEPTRAVEAFRAKPGDFDIVISDMTMPELTGDLLVAEVRRLRPEIPVVLVSGFWDRFTVERARAAGVSEFVDKPLSLGTLAQLIRKLCDRR